MESSLEGLSILMNSGSQVKESIFSANDSLYKTSNLQIFNEFSVPKGIFQSHHWNSQIDSIITERQSRRELSGLLSRWTCAVFCCENETRRLAELSLLQISAPSPNTQQKLPLCSLSPTPNVSANRHCLCFPPAVCLQNDYCMAHTIC